MKSLRVSKDCKGVEETDLLEHSPKEEKFVFKEKKKQQTMVDGL